jgi:hypothetical protein
MTKIEKRQVDKSYEIYLSLYQAVTGTEEEKNIYKQFSPDFFDLVVIDECHRGSAAEDSAWREMLDYFNSAIHLGLTATPKETADVSNISYFGEPVYTYSLRQGHRGRLPRPLQGDPHRSRQGSWLAPHPRQGGQAKGQLVEDRIYNRRRHEQVPGPHPARPAGRRTHHGIPPGHRPDGQDHRVLRGHRPRRAHAPGPAQRQRRTRGEKPQIRHADHRRQRGRQAGAGQLHQPRKTLPGHRHHLTPDDHRRRCQDLQAHRARPHHQLHDRVQADHRPRHPHRRGLRQALVHHPGLQESHRTVRRPGLRRRARGDLRTRRRWTGDPARRPRHSRRSAPVDGELPKTRPAPAASSTSSTTCRSTWSTSASSTTARTAG